MAKATVNPRKAALGKICGKLAMFVVMETYTDEQDAQRLLSEAIGKIDAAVELLVAADERAAAEAAEKKDGNG